MKTGHFERLIPMLLALVFSVFFATSLVAQSSSPGAPVSGQPVNVSTKNFSAVIATGNTFQTVLASNVGVLNPNGTPVLRQALTVQNNNASDSCWITFGTVGGVTITQANAIKAASILLLAGQGYTRYWPFVPNDAIQATCATSSDTLYVEVQ